MIDCVGCDPTVGPRGYTVKTPDLDRQGNYRLVCKTSLGFSIHTSVLE